MVGCQRMDAIASARATGDDGGAEHYALHVAVGGLRGEIVAVASSDGCVRVFDPDLASVRATFRAHQGPITQIDFAFRVPAGTTSSAGGTNEEQRTMSTARQACLLLTSSEDGTLKVWDLTPCAHAMRGSAGIVDAVACVQTLAADGRRSPIWSFAARYDGGAPLGKPNLGVLAASSRGGVVLWETEANRDGLRMAGRKIVALEESFGDDDVTQVAFLPSPATQCVLAAAGEDGLVCIFDLSRGADEDDNLLCVLNAGAAIARIGCCGHALPLPSTSGAGGVCGDGFECFLWCTTRVEGVLVWNWRRAAAEEAEDAEPDAMATDGCDALFRMEDARPAMARPAAGGGGGPGPRKPAAWSYLVGCAWDAQAHELHAVAGTASGDVAFFRLARGAMQRGAEGPTLAFTSGGEGAGEVRRMRGRGPGATLGHADVVRALVADEHGVGREDGWYSCGEDGMVCLWRKGAGARSKGWGTPPRCGGGYRPY